MHFLRTAFVLSFITLLSFSCNKNNNTSSSSSDLPSNLQLYIVVADDDSGAVTITATATNVVSYQFYMGDDGTNEPYENTTGIYAHTYETIGTYTVEVRAYNSTGRYVKKTKQIVVQAAAPVSIGEGYSTPISYEGMSLVWNDEFEGAALSSNKWSHDIGTGCPDLCGWGNQELEYYRPENSYVAGGTFIIEAKAENFSGSNYTSTKVVTRDKFSFKYGRVDIRAVLPQGQGIWPAFWMLGANHSSIGWPQCGEVDIMEMIGGSGRETTVYGNVFWDNNGVTDQRGEYTLSSGIFSDEYHVFSIIWDENQIRWFVDDQQFHSFPITEETRNEFHNEFYLIMNVAVGGIWPGSPDATTEFPQRMSVDYIRVFQQN